MPMNARLLRPRQAGGFNPKTISGLALWLDANDTASLGNTSTGAGGIANNGPVKYWGDRSGNSRNATNSGADSVCPTFLQSSQNGRPAISFDGGDVLDGAFSLTLTAETVIVVGLLSGGGAGARFFTQSDASADFSTTGHYIPVLERTSSGNSALLRPWSSYATSGFRAAVTDAQNTMLVMASRHSGSQISNSTNGGAASTYSHTLNKTFTRYRIGQDFGGTGALAGRICEILVYSRAVTDSEFQSISRYLGTKWGVTVA